MEHIGLYEQITDFTNEGAGTSEWCIGRKNGNLFFVKKYNSPVYPSEKLGLSEEKFKTRVERFHKNMDEKEKLYQLLRTHNENNYLCVPFEVFNYQYHVCTVAEYNPSNINTEEIFRLSPWQKLVLMRSLTLALKDIHHAGIVYSDLRADNILISQNDSLNCQLKVIDFDSAFFEASPPKSVQKIQGDPAYFAPELFQMETDESIVPDRALDIFALGLIFHYYWCGVLPNKPEEYTVGQAVYADKSIELDPELPENVKQLIQKMLKKDPKERIKCTEIYEKLGIEVQSYPYSVTDIRISSEPPVPVDPLPIEDHPKPEESEPNTTVFNIHYYDINRKKCLKMETMILPWNTAREFNAIDIPGYVLFGNDKISVAVNYKGFVNGPVDFYYIEKSKSWMKPYLRFESILFTFVTRFGFVAMAGAASVVIVLFAWLIYAILN